MSDDIIRELDLVQSYFVREGLGFDRLCIAVEEARDLIKAQASRLQDALKLRDDAVLTLGKVADERDKALQELLTASHRLGSAEYSVQCWEQVAKNAQALNDELRKLLTANVVFRCPKCRTETKLPNPLTHLDCLGCGANIISEERPQPSLRVVERHDPVGELGSNGHGITRKHE